MSQETEILLPEGEERASLWSELVAQGEAYISHVEKIPVAPQLDRQALESLLDAFPFEQPRPRLEVFRQFLGEMKNHQVHTPHPCYFGLFNPAPSFMGVLGDAAVAFLNPQLAAWSHSPLAAETETRLIQEFAKKFGYDSMHADGCFTSGGAEANQTALLCALAHRWPEALAQGLRALRHEPVFYASRETHHSFSKAARAVGLGSNALREVPVDERFEMNIDALRQMVDADRGAGREPFLFVANAGATGGGAIDPLGELALLAREQNVWLHVDAAWGGAAVLVPELRRLVAGIEKSDSITFDPHKFLSVPMAAGMFLTNHPQILAKQFGISTAYMPKEGDRLAVVDPYSHTPQWSRRFIGMKLFLTLATAGWSGYEKIIRRQTAMGDLLRRRLAAEGWKVVNHTPLPLICFTDASAHWDMATHQAVAERVLTSGRAWLSTIALNGDTPALRACITNYRTGPEHIEVLLTALAAARSSTAKA